MNMQELTITWVSVFDLLKEELEGYPKALLVALGVIMREEIKTPEDRELAIFLIEKLEEFGVITRAIEMLNEQHRRMN